MLPKYLRLAVSTAARGRVKDKQYHLGAVAIRSDRSIVCSSNRRVEKPSPSQHAEARVLRRAGLGAILYVGRVLANGDWANSKPCSSCQRLIRKAKVKVVYYTISNREFGVWYPI